jgi:tetratricopeptide (TPR) repeat protein
MTDSMETPPVSTKHPILLLVVIVVALIGFSVLVLLEANKKDLNVQEEQLTAGSAETLATLGRYEEAAEVYTELLKRSRSEGQFATYHLNRGNLRFKQERYEDAIADYEASMQLDEIGILYQARWNIAQAYTKVGRTEEAEAAFTAFAEEYGEELPQYKQRARHAIALMEK